MIKICHYNSLIGDIVLASENSKLIGLWIEKQILGREELFSKAIEDENDEILVKTKKWLDRYFRGEVIDIGDLELAPKGSEFRQMVWKELSLIPYGSLTTYKEIAKKIADKTGKRVSCQAVGGAVGHNPISIIIPCHRVVGSNGSLTGYAGGIDIKIKLLKRENVDFSNLYDPREVRSNGKKEM